MAVAMRSFCAPAQEIFISRRSSVPAKKTSMRKQIVIWMVALLILSSAAAQDKTPTSETNVRNKVTKEAKSTPTVDEILDKYLKAIGGKAAVEKLRTQRAQATL